MGLYMCNEPCTRLKQLAERRVHLATCFTDLVFLAYKQRLQQAKNIFLFLTHRSIEKHLFRGDICYVV